MHNEQLKAMLLSLLKEDVEFKKEILSVLSPEIDRLIQGKLENQILAEQEELKKELEEEVQQLEKSINHDQIMQEEILFVSRQKLDMDTQYNLAIKGIRNHESFKASLEEEHAEYIQYLKSLYPTRTLNTNEIVKLFTFMKENKYLEGDLEDFSYVCSYSVPKRKLNWIDIKGYNSKSRKVTYVTIFDLFHNIIFKETQHYEGLKRKLFLEFILDAFDFDGDHREFSSINTAYTNWSNKNRLNKLL